MNMTAWVDVAIGLTLVYLGASLFVTVINEYLAQGLNLRGRQLCDSLKALIGDAQVKAFLTQSPALQLFFDSKPGQAPSYIDPHVLARLLVGGLTVGAAAGPATAQVAETLGKLPPSALTTQLQALVRTAGNSAEALVNAVSEWADRSLTMLGERYKRDLRNISFGLGLAVAVGFNLDTVALTEHLYRDKDAREATVALAVQIAEKTGKETFDKCMGLTAEARKAEASCASLRGLVEAVQGRNESLGKLPIGWSDPPKPPDRTADRLWFWASRLVGWLLTALALSLGAPFWFDLLNKLVNVRHGMRRPEATGGKAAP